LSLNKEKDVKVLQKEKRVHRQLFDRNSNRRGINCLPWRLKQSEKKADQNKGKLNLPAKKAEVKA